MPLRSAFFSCMTLHPFPAPLLWQKAIRGQSSIYKLYTSSYRKAVRVLGIDPGSIKTGFAIIEYTGRSASYIAGGTIVLEDSDPLADRLVRLSKDFKKVIQHYKPQELALESLFFSKNAQSALKLGHARGVLLTNAKEAGLNVFEYTPTAVKSSVCGMGRARKDQVATMVKTILNLNPSFEFTSADESDALALCLTHAQAKPSRPKRPTTLGKKNDRTTFWQTHL